MDFKLEICVDSVYSAVDAQEAGADRIELCDNLIEGGTTPSYGTIMTARRNLAIGLNVLIRPRGGDFLYNDTEFEIMKRDIEKCGECGADGIVTGILRCNGTIDMDRMARLIELARPMTVTFHRAFDLCSNPEDGLKDLIASGIDILLTSGQMNSAEAGSELISKLVRQAGKKIRIMPGSGINDTNIRRIAEVTGASEFHLSARKTIDSEMTFRKEGVDLGSTQNYNEYSRKVADPEKIKNIISILREL